MHPVISKLLTRLNAEGGQTLAEYALILSFIAMACVIALGAIGVSIGVRFDGFTAVL